MIDIIIFAILAIFIIKKLVAILGDEYDNKMFSFGEKDLDKNKIKDINTATVNDASEKNKQFDYLSDQAKLCLKRIEESINDFNLEMFINVSKKVLGVVLEAYTKQDIRQLSILLSSDVLNNLSLIINENNQKKQKDCVSLVSIDDSKILDIWVEDDCYCISINFKTVQFHYMIDDSDNVISGSKFAPNSVEETWVFSKKISDKSPIWLVDTIEIV
jgi:predicted lipid-binding transport protein (Tim44 family)